jgi:choline-sulfatase
MMQRLGQAFVAFLLFASFSVPGLSVADRPNVLFLAVDDMKDWVNCLGGYEGTVHTPNIDRLAKRGILFTNAHCPSPKCAPSRAAIMTGLRSSSTGLYDNNHWWYPNWPEVVTLPVHFRKHGYQVVGAGKIFHHTAGNNPPNQWDYFERFLFRNDPWFRGSKLNYPWSRHTPYPRGFPFGGVLGLGHENDWGVLPISDADHDDARSADYAIGFLQQKQDKSFFLACGLFRPHLPWYVPKKFFDLYPLAEVKVPESPLDDLDDVPPVGRKFAAARRSDLVTIRKSGKIRESVRAYLASISFADAQLGRVLNALDVSPYAEETIVILWSDHGWHLGEKQHWHKSTLWEEATRVPLIISAPGFSSGICKQPVNLIDLYPTLNDLCGFSSPAKLDGTSLVPQLRQPLTKRGRPSITEFRKGNASVRSERWRYIRYADGSEELYDHAGDPNEWTNLEGEPEHASVKQNLASWLPKFWADAALSKQAFQFDPKTFTWRNKKTQLKVSGASLAKP